MSTRGPGLRPLRVGTLPTRSTLNMMFKIEGKPLGVSSVDELMTEMRRLLRAGDGAALKLILARIGFEWVDPEVRA